MAPDENLFENDERVKGDLHDCILKKFSPFYSSKLGTSHIRQYIRKPEEEMMIMMETLKSGSRL